MTTDPLDELRKLGQPQGGVVDPLPSGGGTQAAGGTGTVGTGYATMGPIQGGGATLSALGQPQVPVGTQGPPKPGGGAMAMSQALAPPPAPVGAPPPMSALPAAAAAAPPAPLDPNAVWGKLQSQFQTKFGRAMTGEEATALQKYAGYTGGAIDQGMIDKAGQGIGSYSGNIKDPFGAPVAPTGTAPTGPVDPGIGTGAAAQTELQKLLTTGGTDALNPTTLNNPAMDAQRQAFGRSNDRERGRARLAASERAAAGGTLGSGGYDANLNSIEQGAGDRAVGFESQLMTQELQGQRERVMEAMKMAVSSGDAAQGRALQERLGMIDNQLRKEGMTMQNRLGQGQLNLGLLQALMGDKRSGDQLGLGYAQLGQQASSSLLNTILAGM